MVAAEHFCTEGIQNSVTSQSNGSRDEDRSYERVQRERTIGQPTGRFPPWLSSGFRDRQPNEKDLLQVGQKGRGL